MHKSQLASDRTSSPLAARQSGPPVPAYRRLLAHPRPARRHPENTRSGGRRVRYPALQTAEARCPRHRDGIPRPPHLRRRLSGRGAKQPRGVSFRDAIDPNEEESPDIKGDCDLLQQCATLGAIKTTMSAGSDLTLPAAVTATTNSDHHRSARRKSRSILVILSHVKAPLWRRLIARQDKFRRCPVAGRQSCVWGEPSPLKWAAWAPAAAGRGCWSRAGTVQDPGGMSSRVSRDQRSAHQTQVKTRLPLDRPWPRPSWGQVVAS